VAVEAVCEWGANPGGLGDRSPPAAESFFEKYVQNLVKYGEDF